MEEIARFLLDDESLSQQLKDMRHAVNSRQEADYDSLLAARDTQGDVGISLANPDSRDGAAAIFKANIKRLQQSLRVLAEYTGETVFEDLRYKAYTLEKIIWERLAAPQLGNLYLVTNSDAFENEDEFLDAVAAALSGGVKVVQLREKTAPAKKIIELGRKVKQLCAEFGAVFIVNDRVDIACVLEADGVHLGQDDMSVEDARKILPQGAIVGVSTHAPEQAQKAVADGADYIGTGPVFTTPTKPGRASVGLDYIKWSAQNIDIPAFAIGGIDLDNVEQVLDAGAKRVAVVRAVINAKDPAKAAQTFINQIKSNS